MTSLTESHLCHRTVPGRRPGLRGLLALARQRSALNRLDDRDLADIGLSRDAAEREARRPFWDVPHTWRD